jgi:outer membrane receptor for ferrienterochelin and colicins
MATSLLRALPPLVVSLLSILAVSASAEPKTTEPPLGTLLDMELEALQDVKITTATRRPQPLGEVPATVYVFTREDFARYGFRDLKDVLKNAPGIEYGYPQSWLQGGQRGFAGSWSQTRLLINGRDTNLIFSGEAYIADQFPLHDVEKVEIINGPASALYGPDAFVGLINIVTRNSENSKPGTTISAYAGALDELGDRRQVAASSVQKFGAAGVSWGVAYNQRHGVDAGEFVRTPAFSEVLGDVRQRVMDLGKRYKDYNHSLSAHSDVRYQWTTNDKLNVGFHVWNNFDGGSQENAEVSFSDFRDHRQQLHGYGGYEHRFEGAPIKVALDYHFLMEDNEIDFAERGGVDPLPPRILEFRSENNERHKLVGQVDFDLSRYNNYLLIGGWYRDTSIDKIRFTLAQFDQLEPFSEQEERAIFIQDQQSFFDDRLQLTAGFRYDDHNIYGNVSTPRGGVRYAFTDECALKLMYGEAFLAPTIFELGGNRDLKPATMESSEVAFHFTPGKHITGQVSYYWNRASDIIQQVRSGATEVNLNVGSKETSGVETLLQFQWKPVRAQFWYTHVDEKIDVARDKVGLGVSYDFSDRLSLSLRGKYASSITTDARTAPGVTEMVKIRSFRNADLVLLAREVGMGAFPLDLSLAVYNVFNSDNRYPNVRGPDPIQFREERRSVVLNLAYHFE